MCGVGRMLFLYENNYISLKYTIVHGSNNWAEFYALWLIMEGVVNKGIGKLKDFGNSKFLIDWANGMCQNKNSVLIPIVNRVLQGNNNFYDIIFTHIYRKFNSKAHILSKEEILPYKKEDFTSNS
jgi:hypothetical protein